MSICTIGVGGFVAFLRNSWTFQWAVNFLICLVSTVALTYTEHTGEQGARLSAEWGDYVRVEAQREVVQAFLIIASGVALRLGKHWIFHVLGVSVLGSSLLLAGGAVLAGEAAKRWDYFADFSNPDDPVVIQILIVSGLVCFVLSMWLQTAHWGNIVEETRNSCERIPTHSFFTEGNIHTLTELRKLRNLCKENPALYENLHNKDRFELFLENPRDMGVRL